MGHYTVRTGKHDVGVLLGGLTNNKKTVFVNIVINIVYNKSWSCNYFLNRTIGGARFMVQ